MKKINNYDFLTFIPARAGSKAIKNKNLKKIGSLNLVEHTIKFIKRAKLKKNIICLSTDSLIYKSKFKKYNLDFITLRSKKNSLSNATIESAVDEFLKSKHFKNQNLSFNFLILLLPTQPFRNLKTFKDAIKIAKNNSTNIISIKNLSRSKKYIFNIDKKKILLKQKLKSVNRQYIESNYTPCGCFYIIKMFDFKKKKSFFIKDSRYLITQYPENLDIDTHKDLKLANNFFKNKNLFF